MTSSFLIPALFFGTLLAALWFGVMGIKGVKREKKRGRTSAMERHGDAQAQRDDPKVTSVH